MLGFPFLADLDLSTEQAAWPRASGSSSPPTSGNAGPDAFAAYGTEPSPQPTTSAQDGGEADVERSTTASAPGEIMFYVEGDQWRSPWKAPPTRRHFNARGSGLVHERTSPTASSSRTTGRTAEATDVDAPQTHIFDAMFSKIRDETSLRQGHTPVFTDFPSSTQMQGFFRNYFQCFHNTFPFLRQDASFYELPCHWVLLLSVCAVGSRYCSASSSNEHNSSSLLFSILEKSLLHRAGGFPFETPLLPWASPQKENPDDDALSLLQAAVLNLIWKVHSGSEAAGRGALTERHRIVQGCRNMDLLGEAVFESEHVSETRDWWEEQSRIRTGLTIWVRSFGYEGLVLWQRVY